MSDDRLTDLESVLREEVPYPYHYLPADRPKVEDVKTVVIFQKKNLGDAVLLLPVIQNLSRLMDSVQIQVVVRASCIPIFSGIPKVTCHEMPGRWRDWVELIGRLSNTDIFLDFQNTPRYRWLGVMLRARVRSGLPVRTCWVRDTHPVSNRELMTRHQIQRNLDVLRRLGMPVSDQESKIRLPKHLSPSLDVKTRTYIVVHPGSRWMFKSLTIDQWVQLIDAIAERNLCSIVITGGDTEAEMHLAQKLALNEAVENRCGRTSVGELMALIQGARGFIGVDSFAAHLANAYAIPGLVLFGPSDPKRWGPRPGDSLKVPQIDRAKFPCMPCNLDGCGGGKISMCLMSLETKTLLAEFDSVMSDELSCANSH